MAELTLLPTQVWYGAQPAKKEFFAPVQAGRSGLYKPLGGGMWTSTWTPSGDYECDWARFCIDDGWETGLRGGVSYQLTPLPCRVLEIDTLEDLKEAIAKYPDTSYDDYRLGGGMDYIAVSQDYDAVHLTEEGQWRTRLEHPSLYGWDCECTLWFRWMFKEE